MCVYIDAFVGRYCLEVQERSAGAVTFFFGL